MLYPIDTQVPKVECVKGNDVRIGIIENGISQFEKTGKLIVGWIVLRIVGVPDVVLAKQEIPSKRGNRIKINPQAVDRLDALTIIDEFEDVGCVGLK